MNIIDMRTVILSYILSNGVCAVVIASLWYQGRRRYTGLGLALTDFILQFAALLLVALRGRVPDLLSATISNGLIIGGTILLYMGLERFVGKSGRQVQNFILLGFFLLLHVYFILVVPSLDVRTILLSLGLLAICSQCAWLLLGRVDADMRPITRSLGFVFVAFCLLSLVRIIVDLFAPLSNDFYQSTLYDALAVMAYQMLFIILAVGLFLMVNRRLLTDLEREFNERKRAEQATLLLASIVESTDDAIFGKSLDGTILSWNAGAEKMYGYTSEEIIGQPVSLLAPPDRKDEMDHILETLKQGDLIQHLDTERVRKNGRTIDVALTISALRDAAGNITGASTIARDVTHSKQMERELLQLSRAVEQSPASIMITDTKGMIEYVNPRFTQQTGYSLDEVLGLNPRLLQSGKTPPETYRHLWETLRLGKEFRCEFVNKKKSGELYYESAILSPIMDSRGLITHYLAVNEDITQRKQTEQQIELLQTQLREQAIRDPLTGLFNRRYLDETLGRELDRARRESSQVSFIMIDLDHFKRLNDTLGHLAGDEVLKKLAAQILGRSRSTDIICRYGGEEFLAVLPNTKAESAFQVAEHWRNTFRNSGLPGDFNYPPVTISCGISEFPLHGATCDELIGTADSAMYQAKDAGRNQVRIWGKDGN